MTTELIQLTNDAKAAEVVTETSEEPIAVSGTSGTRVVAPRTIPPLARSNLPWYRLQKMHRLKQASLAKSFLSRWHRPRNVASNWLPPYFAVRHQSVIVEQPPAL
jgi:hypothetical protein